MQSPDFAWAPWTILLPILGACLIVGLSARRAAGRGLLLGTLLATLLAGMLALERCWRVGAEQHAVGGWQPPLGIVLTLDGWGLGFVVLGTGIALLVGWFALRGWPERPFVRARFSPLLLLLVAGLNALFLSGDLFNIYVTLEVVSIAAVGLAAIERDRSAVRASLEYLMLSLAGSFSYLAGVVLVYREHGVLDLGLLAERVTAEPISVLATTLMTAGLLLKAALFPLHAWLPPAHSSAPAPVSALLSGLVVKCAFFALLRVSIATWPDLHAGGIPSILGLLGTCGIVWGYCHALRSDRLKPILAYSTVAQMGQLFVVFPLISAGAPGAVGGALLMAAAHALAKASLFLSAGNVLRATGGDRLDDLAACARHLPMTQAALAFASLSLVGLPPSAGFAGKFLLVEGALETGQWFWCLALAVGALLGAAVMLRILERCVTTGEPDAAIESSRVSEWPPFVLGLAATGLGLLTGPVLELAQRVDGPAARLMGSQ